MRAIGLKQRFQEIDSRCPFHPLTLLYAKASVHYDGGWIRPTSSYSSLPKQSQPPTDNNNNLRMTFSGVLRRGPKCLVGTLTEHGPHFHWILDPGEAEA